MSEVKRWKLKGFLPGVEGECKAVFQPTVVMAEDLDRVVAERDALQALLTKADEELDRAGGAYLNKNAECLQLRERADVLEGLLRDAQKAFDYDPAGSCYNPGIAFVKPWSERVIAALKPAECCTVSAEHQALLAAGEYTPEELFGVGGKPSCPKCAKP